MARILATLLAALLSTALLACGRDTTQPETALSWTAVSAGILHTCAIRSDGEGYCWGANQAAQLGSVGTRGPTAISGGHAWKAIAAGESFTCGISTGGQTYCWGDNFRGQLGVGVVDGSVWENRRTPTRVAGNHQFSALAAGEEYTCAASTAGEVYCWGDGFTRGNGAVPERVNTSMSVASLVTGGTGGRSHECGMVGTDVYCWGFNASGQVGGGFANGAEVSYHSDPVRVQAPAGVVFRGLTAGGGPWHLGYTGHTCALSAEGDAYCWGDNRYGQLADGSTVSRPAPVPVGGGLKFTSLSAGGNHTCGITRNGDLYCWGDARAGQLGGRSGTGGYSSSPVAVPVPR